MPEFLRLVSSWIVALAACMAGLAGPLTSQRDEPLEPQVLIVPVHGPVDTMSVALVRRGLREAQSLQVGWIVLDIDTPGGAVVALKEIESLLDGVRGSGVRPIAFVRQHALSAGAYLALTCAET